MTITTGSYCEITLNMLWLNQQSLNVFQYAVAVPGAPPGAVQIAEAWWLHVKAVYRALSAPGQGNVFKTVRIRELNNDVGDYAEYDIPLADQAGVRGSSPGEPMPPFAAAGVRLVVGTRATRPGQKRLPFVYEVDSNAGVMQSALLTLMNSWAGLMTVQLTLGAPAALTALTPIVCKKNSEGFVTDAQDVTGYLINQNITTQNSRKIGRGA